MGEEPGDACCVEIADVQACGGLPRVPVDVGEEELERVAVSGNRVRAGVALGDEPVGEERLQQRRERGHERACPAVGLAAVRRPAARASSSGTAVRYQ